jgi:3-phenylpropionate/cinnamic acid dioxygenase small subunit
MLIEDTFDIKDLLARFANSFDLKDWDGLLACLAEQVYTDYSDLRGTPSEAVRAVDYVQARRESLQDLKTHHLSGNVEISYVDLLNAVCRVSTAIWRKSETETFNTHCVYTFNVTKGKYDWKISAIIQKVLWSEGQSSIYLGAK